MHYNRPNLTTLAVATALFLCSCAYQQKQKLEKEVARLQEQLALYKEASQDEKLELTAQVLFLKDKLADLQAQNEQDTTEYKEIEKSLRTAILQLEKEILGLEVETEQSAQDKEWS